MASNEFYIILVISLVLIVILSYTAKRSEEGYDERYTILAFGDSLTTGYIKGGRDHKPYSKELKRLLVARGIPVSQLRIITAGKDGESTETMPERLQGIINRYRSSSTPITHCIILVGTNDLSTMKPSQIAWNIDNLHRIASECGAHTVAVTIPQMAADKSGLHIAEVRKVVNEAIRSGKIAPNALVADVSALLQFHNISREQKAYLWDDGIHYTAAGYVEMARIFEKVLERDLKLKR